MIDNWNIEKLIKPFFPGKFIFAQIWSKRAKNGPIIGFFELFEKFYHKFFLEKNLK